MDGRTDDVGASSGARHRGRIKDEGADDAIVSASIELGVVEVIGVIERDSQGLLNACDDADLMTLGVELVDGVVAERIDEDMAGATDKNVIGRGQGREA